MQNFFPSNAMMEAIPYASRAAGSADINCATVDREKTMAECIGLNLEFGAIAATAVTSVHWQGSVDGSTWVDLAGTKIDVAHDDDNKYVWTELRTPVYRYVRAVVNRGTANATVRSAIYVLGSTRRKRDYFGTEWLAHKVFLAPEAGTP